MSVSAVAVEGGGAGLLADNEAAEATSPSIEATAKIATRPQLTKLCISLLLESGDLLRGSEVSRARARLHSPRII